MWFGIKQLMQKPWHPRGWHFIWETETEPKPGALISMFFRALCLQIWWARYPFAVLAEVIFKASLISINHPFLKKSVVRKSLDLFPHNRVTHMQGCQLKVIIWVHVCCTQATKESVATNRVWTLLLTEADQSHFQSDLYLTVSIHSALLVFLPVWHSTDHPSVTPLQMRTPRGTVVSSFGVWCEIGDWFVLGYCHLSDL